VTLTRGTLCIHSLHSNICNCYASQDYAAHCKYCKHVKVSLCAYNHTVNYSFCLAEYMLRALCRARHLDPSQCSCMSSEVWTGCIANVHLQEHTHLSPSTVKTSSLCLLCPQLPHWRHVAFICTGWPVLQKSWWQQPQQQVQHFWQESTTHYPQQPQQQQWWQLNAQPAKRRYLAKTVCLHFSGLSPLWLGFTGTLWCIQMITVSTPNEHPNALLSKCCHCFHQIKIIFCKMKTVEASSTL
jgi:hypothetical protein